MPKADAQLQSLLPKGAFGSFHLLCNFGDRRSCLRMPSQLCEQGLSPTRTLATLFAMYTLHWAVVTNQFALAHCNVEQLVLPPWASFVAANGSLHLAERVRHLNPENNRLR
jgi:hypothetical protein